MSKFLSGRQSNLNIGITSYTESKTVLQTTGKVGIGTTDAQQHSLFVVGSTNITDEVIVGGGLTAVGIGSFQSDVYIDNQLYVGGINITGGASIGEDVTTRNIEASGISTFVGIATAQSTLFAAELSVAGISTFEGNIDANGDLDVDGRTELDIVNISETLNVVGVSTFVSDVDIDGDIDIDGHTELDNVNISGVTTFVGSITASDDLDVDGHTDLDNVSISGVTTTTGLLDVNGGLTANEATVEDLTNDRIVIVGAGGRLEDSANLTFDNVTLNVVGQVETDKLNVSGVSTFAGDIDANGDLDVDGQTELDNVNVSGVATVASLDVQTNFDVYDTQAVFHNDVLISGNLSIGGTTTVIQAQDLKVFDKDIVLGVTTDTNGEDISNDNTANHGGIAIASTEGSPLVPFFLSGVNEDIPDTYKQIMWVKSDSYGFGTTDAWLFNYAVGIGSTLVPNGTRLAVSEIQFTDDTINAPNLGISKDVSISGDIDVDGHTDLDNVSISGVTTFTKKANFSDDIDVDGQTELDHLNVSGVSTFVGITTNESTLFANQLSVSGFTTVGNIQVGGFTPDGTDFGGVQYILRANGTGGWEWANVPGIFSVNNILNGFTVSEEGPSNTVGTAGSITQLDFRGVNVTATADAQPNGIATITFSPTPTFDTLNVSGITTIAGITTVSGDTLFAKQVSVSGLSTFVGVGTFQSDLYVGGDLYVRDDLVFDAFTAREINVTETSNLENLYVAGVSTFVGIATAESTLFTNQLSVSGVSTFVDSVTFNNDIDVDGHTELDNVNVSGVVTSAQFIGPLTGNVAGTATTATRVQVSQGGSQEEHFVMLARDGSIDSAVRLDSGIKFHTGTNDLTISGYTIVGTGLSVVGVTTLASAGGITTTGGNLYVENDLYFKGDLYQNNQLFTSGIGIGSTSVNPGSGVIGLVNNRIGVGFTDINIVGTGISVTGYGSTVVIDFGNIAAASGGALSISTVFSPRLQDVSFVGGASTSVIGVSTQTDRFVYDTQTGSVGIGTSGASIPQYKLDVNGDINSSTSVRIQGVDVLEESVRLAIALG